ncbi:MAG TPA: S8 family serine peptidase, partial [Vicinamibacteria bacterium]|nr:S8 family serine peptidase [Vicinamibacteria bacterium]
RGVIVVAAAGNEVGFVVWPARFEETVAVAAANVDCGLWDGSSRGEAVDIAAPGESVWRADSTPQDSVGMGQGTTFATATTAGLAALWLDYHAASPHLARLKAAGQATDAFRRALQATSWLPSRPPSGITCSATGWDARRQGPGIANAEGLLAFDLAGFPGPAGTPRSGGAPETLDDLPLFASLFPPNVTRVEIRQRFTRLMSGAPPAPWDAVAQLEGEVMHHYVDGEQVRTGLDALATSTAPADGDYAAARAALRERDLSPSLRAALGAAGPTP